VIVGLLATGLWHRHRIRKEGPRRASQRNPDVILDIGMEIEVDHWTDGRARVNYRGSQWDAVPEHPDAPALGKLVIKEVTGSTLILGEPAVKRA
jgi:membrane protein implicated in regulation of membrane protease activity